MQTTLTPEDKPRHGFQHKIDNTCFPATRRATTVPMSRNWTYEAVQEMKVKARKEALDEESIQIAHARACGKNLSCSGFRKRRFKEAITG